MHRAPENEATAGNSLASGLGVTDCLLLVAGNMIGTGIFLTTGTVAELLPSPLLILLAWLVGGIFALAGALCYAELGAMFPRAGGHYVYMREAYGPFWGFLDGWLSVAVAFPCSIAFMAVGLSKYLGGFFPACAADRVIFRLAIGGAGWAFRGEHVPAVAAIAALTVVNCLGLRAGKRTQNALTLLKIACLAGLIVMGFAAGGNAGAAPWTVRGDAKPALPALASALIGISFAYLGWDASTYMAAETRRPQRTIPLSLAIATGAVAVLYLLFNAALLRIVPVAEMRGSANVAQTAAQTVFGQGGAAMISAAIAVCILGAMNATIMVGPRVGYAMARDGLFFSALRRVHARSRVPQAAIIAQGLWTCVIVLTGTFVSILIYSVFATLVLSIATGAAVIVLRVRKPQLARPYRTWGYPWVPLLYGLGTAGIALHALVVNPRQSAWSLAAVAVGTVLYACWRARDGA